MEILTTKSISKDNFVMHVNNSEMKNERKLFSSELLIKDLIKNQYLKSRNIYFL